MNPKAVLDSNVIVSALLRKDGPAAQIRHAWMENSFTVCLSPALIREVRDVLSRPWFMKFTQLSLVQIEEYLERLFHDSLISDPIRTQSFSRDPDDDHVIAAAIACGADFIVTGDRDLLVLKPGIDEIQILTLREFLKLMRISD